MEKKGDIKLQAHLAFRSSPTQQKPRRSPCKYKIAPFLDDHTCTLPTREHPSEVRPTLMNRKHVHAHNTPASRGQREYPFKHRCVLYACGLLARKIATKQDRDSEATFTPAEKWLIVAAQQSNGSAVISCTTKQTTAPTPGSASEQQAQDYAVHAAPSHPLLCIQLCLAVVAWRPQQKNKAYTQN